MSRDEIKTKLKSLFANIKKKKLEVDIKEDNKLGEDLDLDSLERVEMLFEIEQNFSIKIEDEEARELKTVKDIIDMIQDKTKIKSGG